MPIRSRMSSNLFFASISKHNSRFDLVLSRREFVQKVGDMREVHSLLLRRKMEVYYTKRRRMDREKKQWHPAFHAVLQIELEEEKDALIFEEEHLLSKKPLQIDVLVVKKQKNILIKKNIGRIFRKHNIIEYKSPEDYLSINDFYKVYAYACLYQADTEKVMEIDPAEITLTFVCSHFPKKMAEHLCTKRNLLLEKVEKGIYYLKGDLFQIQIVVNTELSKEGNYWLQSLRNDLRSGKEIRDLVERYEKKKDSNLYQAVMDLIVRANWEKMKEEKMMCDALKELFAEELEESNRKGISQGLNQGIVQGEARGIKLTKMVFKLAGQGETPEQIAGECGITKEKVLEILE